jgi:hypothetical protein
MQMVIIITVGVAVIALIGIIERRWNWVFNRLMLWSAGLGFFIGYSVIHLEHVKEHKGPGFVAYSGDEQGNGDEMGEDEVPESEYKQHEYTMGVIMLVLGVWVWVAIAKWARTKNELEKSWVRMILNPNNVQEIQRHPEQYREDFRQWIKEHHPHLLLQANRPQEVQPPTGDPVN